MAAVLEKLLTMLFFLAIAIAIGLLLYRYMPNTVQTWVQTQMNAIFNMGNNLITNATGT